MRWRWVPVRAVKSLTRVQGCAEYSRRTLEHIGNQSSSYLFMHSDALFSIVLIYIISPVAPCCLASLPSHHAVGNVFSDSLCSTVCTIYQTTLLGQRVLSTSLDKFWTREEWFYFLSVLQLGHFNRFHLIVDLVDSLSNVNDAKI